MDDTHDMDIFLEALDNLPDDVIRAKYDGHVPHKTGQRNVNYRSAYDETLDLHGLTRREALSDLRNTLTVSKGKRLRLLVITGRGNNSEGGYGVLRKAVLDYLDKAGSLYVRDYGFASAKNGGDGAIEIITK